MILILSCGEFHIHMATEYFCVCLQTVEMLGKACRLTHQSYETEEEWEQSDTMNESGREGGENSNRRVERQRCWGNHRWKKILWFIFYVINSHLCVVFSVICRIGLNLLEEDARKKMSNHGLNSLSAAQVDALPAANAFFLLSWWKGICQYLVVLLLIYRWKLAVNTEVDPAPWAPGWPGKWHTWSRRLCPSVVHLQWACCTTEWPLVGMMTRRVTADKKEKVGTEGGFIHSLVVCLVAP